MNSKFNLALIPIHCNDKVVNLSQSLAKLADKYILDKNSLAHVTLYQFFCDDNKLNEIWQATQSIDHKFIELEFNHIHCKTFDNETYWISLKPDQRELLTVLHAKTATILNLPIKDNYDPHMTLISSKNKDCEKEAAVIMSDYSPIVDTFVLSLGACDEIGQFTQTIYIRK